MSHGLNKRTNQRTRKMTFAAVGLIAVSATAFGGAGMAALSQSGQSATPPATAVGTHGAGTTAPQPTSISIPTIGLRQSLVRLATQSGNTMQLPPYTGVGWFTGSTAPGATGAAVVAGYIGNSDNPGAFVNLASLHPGGKISVVRQDGSIADFSVTDIRAYDPGKLPLDEIYSAERPTLRIVTTGGALRQGDPNRNVVVTSELAGIR